METEYSRIEFELKDATLNYTRAHMVPHTEAQIKVAQNRLVARLSKLNISGAEKRHPKLFLYWLMEKYLHAPFQKQIENLSTLHIINYKFSEKNTDGLSLIHYLANHPENIKLLDYYFQNCPKHLIEFNDPFHPLLKTDLEDILFRFLVIKFDKYNSSNLTALNFAIAKGHKKLVVRILKHFPEMLIAYSTQGINPLTQAIFTESEDMLDFILSFNPLVDFQNTSFNSLAHLVFLVKDKTFLEKIIFDPKYAVLNLQSQISSQTLRNAFEQLPLFCALNTEHYEIFEHILSANPSLKTEFPHMALGLIKVPEHHGLNYLHRQQYFSVTGTPAFFSKFIIYFLNFKQYHLLEWLSQLDELDVNYKKAFTLLQAIISKNTSKVRELLSDASIFWYMLLPIISWKVTELLIENGYASLIVEFDLFERHDYFIFQHDDDLQGNFLSFLPIEQASSVELKISPVYRPLVEYFCGYLNRHRDRYPSWVKVFGDPIFFVNSYLHQYQIDVHDEPLLHYYESFVFNAEDRIPVITRKLANPTPQAIQEAFFGFYQKQMALLIGHEKLDVNVKDKAGLHLFAKLIQTNQLIRIRYLKEQYAQITLENLDPLGSNLLHLACHNNYLETVKWCIKEKIDPHQIRPFDNRLPIEIAFENLHMDIVNYLRKLVKPSTFIEVLKHLIRNGNDALIHYLLENGFFGFKLSPHHLGLIKSLSNPILDRFFSRSEAEQHETTVDAAVEIKPREESKEEPLLPVQTLEQVTEAPKKTSALNQGALNAYRSLLHKASLENLNNITKILKQDIYHEPLREIFGENILAYALKIISSECSGLIKQFFRIRIVNELMNVDENWYQLITRINLAIKPYILNLICEQEIARAQISSHLSELIIADIASIDIFKFYSSTFVLSSENLRKLIAVCLESGNTDLLNELLKNEATLAILLDSPMSTLMSSFEQSETFSQFLLNLPFFIEHLAAEDNLLLRHAIYLNKPAVIKQLLEQTSVRTQFLKTGFAVIEDIMSSYQEELFPLFIDYPDLESLLSQFPSLQALMQKHSGIHHSMVFRLPLIVDMQELYNAIQTSNFEALKALYHTITMTPKLIEELLHLSVSSGNIDGLKLIMESNAVYLHTQLASMRALLISAIHERNHQIFEYIVDYSQPQYLNVLLDINVFKHALSGDNINIIIHMLRYSFIQKHAHKFSQRTLKKAIAYHNIELIDFLLELPNVKSNLLGNCEALVEEALKKRNPCILFHLLLNNTIFVNSIQNPQLTPELLTHFTDFFIQNYKQQRSIPHEKLQTIELMQSTEILTPFHGELRKLKHQFFTEKHQAGKSKFSERYHQQK